MSFRPHIVFLFAAFLLASSCGKQSQQPSPQKEDTAAKKMLQGVWLNDGDGDVAFRAKGDTIYYADSTSLPVFFQIIKDTLVLHGASDVKYGIVRQAAHLFVFVNQNGEQVKLVKSSDPNDLAIFEETENRRPAALNQNRLIKRDTVVTLNDTKYHCYVQVNPTTYRVIKPSFNDEGVEVDNAYYDNIIHLSIYRGASRIFSKDFRKADFSKIVPSELLTVSILSDLLFYKTDASGIHYTASIAVPDEPTSFQVDVCISENGTIKMQVR